MTHAAQRDTAHPSCTTNSTARPRRPSFSLLGYPLCAAGAWRDKAPRSRASFHLRHPATVASTSWKHSTLQKYLMRTTPEPQKPERPSPFGLSAFGRNPPLEASAIMNIQSIPSVISQKNLSQKIRPRKRPPQTQLFPAPPSSPCSTW